ncbi:MAG: peptidoglycan DD-metalloendopeptidase family protein [Caulobacteraceae bacterium]
MKFNSQFRNRYIYFIVFLAVALLLAGGAWRYRSYLEDKRAQIEFQKNFDELTDEEASADPEVEIIKDNVEDKSGTAGDAEEVLNSTSTKVATGGQDVKNTAAKPEGNKSGSGEKTISAIKMEEPKMETMVVPVFGTAYTEFSDDALIYSKTLDQWTTHLGIDIKADEGSPVRAAMDGVVEKVTNDPELGLTIIINHGGNSYTKYSNLSTLDMVSVGQKVKKGDVISGVGKTALYEIADDPHLHFEVLKDEKSMDPKRYLPKQSLKR